MAGDFLCQEALIRSTGRRADVIHRMQLVERTGNTFKQFEAGPLREVVPTQKATWETHHERPGALLERGEHM